MVATHACTKLYTKMMGKFLAFMSGVYAWPLPEASDLNHRPY